VINKIRQLQVTFGQGKLPMEIKKIGDTNGER
jgi:hypothetical protein